MSETVRPSDTQVNAARGIVEINQRLGEETANWIKTLAATRLPTDPAGQASWVPDQNVHPTRRFRLRRNRSQARASSRVVVLIGADLGPDRQSDDPWVNPSRSRAMVGAYVVQKCLVVGHE